MCSKDKERIVRECESDCKISYLTSTSTSQYWHGRTSTALAKDLRSEQFFEILNACERDHCQQI